MARWLVEIQGDDFDVDEFPFWFSDGEVFAVREEGKVYCVGTIFERYRRDDESSEVQKIARRVVDEWFEVIAILQGGLRRPSVGVVWREDDTGRRGFANMTASLSGRSKMHATATVSGDPTEKRRTQAQEFLAVARASPALRVALTLYSLPNATWPHLYRCLEEVEHYLGEKVNESVLPTISSRERTRFEHSANSDAAGLDSRHREGLYDPPATPMSLSEARDFITRVLDQTLRLALAKLTTQVTP